MRLKRDKVALGGGVVVLLLLLWRSCAGPITPLYGHDPFTFNSNLIDANLGTPKGSFGGVSWDHWLGVEPINGRDLFARIVYGARISMLDRVPGDRRVRRHRRRRRHDRRLLRRLGRQP